MDSISHLCYKGNRSNIAGWRLPAGRQGIGYTRADVQSAEVAELVYAPALEAGPERVESPSLSLGTLYGRYAARSWSRKGCGFKSHPSHQSRMQVSQAIKLGNV